MVALGEPRTDRKTGANSDRMHAAARDPAWLWQLIAARRPALMGILNLTPDSFSDGGQFIDAATAIAHARQMIAAGADIVDIGAESTRPYGGAVRVSAEEERRRLAPVLGAACALGTPVATG